MNNTLVPLASRILLSILFFVAGYGKITHVASTTGYLGKLGLPMPEVLVWGVIAIELVGALLIVLGWQTRVVAWIMALFTLGTALIGHKFWIDPSQATQFMKNLGIMGGFLLLAAYGPGRASIDRR